MTSSTSYYSWIGNVGYALTIVVGLLFAAAVVRYIDDDKQTLFDNAWRKDGFCVTAADIPYWSSHDVCLYVDVLLALVTGILYYAFRNVTALKHPNTILATNVFGILGHGSAHGLLGYLLRSNTVSNSTESSSNDSATQQTQLLANFSLEKAMPYLILMFFWITLLKAVMPYVKWNIIILGAVLSVVGNILVPPQLGFTYVQTVLLVAFAVNQLLRPMIEKDFHYAVYAWVVGLPLLAVGWMESTQCTAFVQSYLYGHVVYDAFIPLSIMVWYGLCVFHYRDTQGWVIQQGQVVTKEKKTL